MYKKAEMGIGTLIIFIAMILVAAIAAGVLVQTATSLQNKALLTGERSKSQVSTSVRPLLIYTEDGSTGNNIEFFYIKAKLVPGSDAIKLGDMLIEFDLKNATSDMEYNNSLSSCTSLTNETNVTSTFFVETLIQGSNYADGYLQRGDILKICFESPRPVEEDESVSVSIIPKIGNPSIIDMSLPDIITEHRITIYP